jgi:hypothetical protein
MAPLSLYLLHQGVLITPLRMLHYSRAAARCNNRTLVASDPLFLGTCRLRYLLKLLLALVPLTSPASCAIPLSSLLLQVRKQRECLLASYSEVAIEIETQYQDLVSVYQKEQTLKACLNNSTDGSKFADVWHMLGEKFTPLRDFAGGLATVSPSTATVESDFSLIKWEKNKFRSAPTDFSLEGILHYKQYEAIQSIIQSRLAICSGPEQPQNSSRTHYQRSLWLPSCSSDTVRLISATWNICTLYYALVRNTCIYCKIQLFTEAF